MTADGRNRVVPIRRGGGLLSTLLSRSKPSARRSEMGHEDQFPLRRLTARSVIRKRIVAATRGNGRDAPKAVTSMEL